MKVIVTNARLSSRVPEITRIPLYGPGGELEISTRSAEVEIVVTMRVIGKPDKNELQALADASKFGLAYSLEPVAAASPATPPSDLDRLLEVVEAEGADLRADQALRSGTW